MIKVEIENNKIEIKGHANYDTIGKDIVCASVSSIAISSINLALRFDKDSLKVVEKEGYVDKNNKIYKVLKKNIKEIGF